MNPIPRGINELRSLFECSITGELFQDPVTEQNDSCRHTFEREAILEWLSISQRCPISRQELQASHLVENARVKNVCSLLSPNRSNPLTYEEIQEINTVAQAFLNRETLPQDSTPLAQRVRDILAQNNSKKKDFFSYMFNL